MIDHVGISVANYERARAFYEAALAPLGYTVVVDREGQIGFGRGERAYLWMSQTANPTRPVHIAIAARSREEVHAFHRAALAAGAEDEGAPAVRYDGVSEYFGASVRDGEDRKIEAVYRS
ncbi:MAG TPA: VOC family protein [Candidatus Saccharimonadia bacterium]|nr:VOC family protein [Candidatus Saccharimonadia bacterium]